MTVSYRSNTCCGLYEVGNFRTHTWDSTGTKPIPIEKDVIVKEIKESIGVRENYLNFSTVNDQQYKFPNLIQALTECGFEEQVHWKNPNSGHEVKFFLRLPNSLQKEKKKVG